MDEDKAAAIINRAERAQQLLNSKVFQEATDELKKVLIARWEQAKDSTERERIWHSVNLLEAIKNTLSGFAATGRYEDRKIQELASGRTKRFGIV